MSKRLTFYDYEKAYVKNDIQECKRIGCELLATLHTNDQAWTLHLLTELSALKWNWNQKGNPKKTVKMCQLLLDVKLWLMVWQ